MFQFLDSCGNPGGDSALQPAMSVNMLAASLRWSVLALMAESSSSPPVPENEARCADRRMRDEP